MPNIKRDMMVYDLKTTEKRMSAFGTAFENIDEYNQTNGIRAVNKLMIKQKFRAIKRFLLQLFVHLFWNLFMIAIFSGIFLIIYNFLGLNFLQPYFDALTNKAINIIFK